MKVGYCDVAPSRTDTAMLGQQGLQAEQRQYHGTDATVLMSHAWCVYRAAHMQLGL